MTREITENDFDGLFQLYMQLHDNPFPTKDDRVIAIWNDILNDKKHHIIVADENCLLVSSCVCVIIPNLTRCQRPYAFIENVITNKNYRNMGFATAYFTVILRSADISDKLSGLPFFCYYDILNIMITPKEGENMKYIVFDVETPNRANNRMSAIGITVIEEGKIANSFFSLVDPETHFDYFNTQLTGISGRTVQGSPNFAKLWEQIEPLMDSGILVAHNAVFDMGVLKKCLHDYGIAWKSTVKYLCTVQTGRRLLPGMSHSLNVMCDHYGILLDHHQADSDSRACAEILLRYIESGADVNSFIRTYRLT